MVTEGDIVTLDGIGVCSVVSTADPSLVTVRLPAGNCIRIGERAIEQLRASNGPNSADSRSAWGRGGSQHFSLTGNDA